tara:strand:- start:3652 stop:4758 length:1107 start_codon:yes stop_codon:yes gene_type:complete
LLDKLKTIPLNDFHLENGAKFIPFAGYSMPINYSSGIINEHIQVRNKSGVFDVSHMGQILIDFNNNNINNLEKFIPLKLNKLKINKSNYSFLLNSNGCVIDDIIISILHFENNKKISIVYNASRKEIVENIFKNNLDNYNLLSNNSLFAIQGPLSYEILSKIINIRSEMKFLDIEFLKYKNNNLILSRSGYTGEDGFELSVPNDLAENFLKNILISKDCNLCGLGSRDSLRIEAGLCLYGNELNENLTPIDANMTWALDIDRIKSNNLNGNAKLKNQLINKPKFIKIGMIAKNKVILRKDMTLIDKNNNNLGRITSGCYSPMLSKSIALGYIDINYDLNENFYCNIRNNLECINYSKLPFVNKNYKRS